MDLPLPSLYSKRKTGTRTAGWLAGTGGVEGVSVPPELLHSDIFSLDDFSFLFLAGFTASLSVHSCDVIDPVGRFVPHNSQLLRLLF